MVMANISNRDFVVAWATAKTMDEVVKTTGLARPTASTRASYLRGKGVKLKKFSKHGALDDFDIALLNWIYKKHEIKEAS